MSIGYKDLGATPHCLYTGEDSPCHCLKMTLVFPNHAFTPLLQSPWVCLKELKRSEVSEAVWIIALLYRYSTFRYQRGVKQAKQCESSLSFTVTLYSEVKEEWSERGSVNHCSPLALLQISLNTIHVTDCQTDNHIRAELSSSLAGHLSGLDINSTAHSNG